MAELIRPARGLEAAGATDVGHRREVNEDALLVSPALGLFAVCDGLGGHASGEVASALAVKSLAAFIQALSAPGALALRDDDTGASLLIAALRAVNHALHRAGKEDPALEGMGSTAVALWATEAGAWVGWVGDSRAYLLRGGALQPISEDHSLVRELLQAGELTDAQAEAFEHKNVITRALGPAADVVPEVKPVALQPGDLLLLCSDGLHGLVSDLELAQILSQDAPLAERAQRCIDAANDAGGTDNITCVLVRAG